MVYAARAGEEKHPIFTGGFAPDVRFFGFDIDAETIGMFSWMLRVIRVRRETSRGRTVEWSGTSRTSSKVSALVITRMPIARRKAALYAPRCDR